jgi:hypothetical protein
MGRLQTHAPQQTASSWTRMHPRCHSARVRSLNPSNCDRAAREQLLLKRLMHIGHPIYLDDYRLNSSEARFKLPNWSGELARITESERGHAAGVLVKDQCAGDWRYGALTALWLDGPGISRLTRSPLDRTAHRAARRGPASETGASDGEAATPGPGALRTGILTDDSLFYAILTCAVVRPPPQPIDWR